MPQISPINWMLIIFSLVITFMMMMSVSSKFSHKSPNKLEIKPSSKNFTW